MKDNNKSSHATVYLFVVVMLFPIMLGVQMSVNGLRIGRSDASIGRAPSHSVQPSLRRN